MTKAKLDNVQRIYSDLKRQIIMEELKKGDRLVETGIAKKYNVSRLHVKEAFKLLEGEQLVEYIKMRGFVVLGVSSKTIEEVAQIRQALEEVVIKEIIKIATREDIDVLNRILGRLKVFADNGMFDDCFEELDKFYEYMYGICDYKRIVGILNTYNDYIFIIIRMSATQAQHHIEGYKSFERLMAAIESKDEQKALNEIRIRHKYLVFNDR